MMYRVLSNEEELEIRKKNFKKIKKGTIFNVSKLDNSGQPYEAYFIAINKPVNSLMNCLVIELTTKNIENIIKRFPCEQSSLAFNQMNCLNICSK